MRVGRATLTIVPSRTVTKTARQVTARIAQRLRSPLGSGRAGGEAVSSMGVVVVVMGAPIFTVASDTVKMNLGSVKTERPVARMEGVTSATTASADTTGDGYHHGDLPNALRRAAVEVIEERGAGGFSLREVARRAGVSHTAPAHHFGDMKGLLTSVAQEGFAALQTASEEAVATTDDPVEQLTALGRAYVALASTHRGNTEVMFRTDIVDPDDPELQACGLGSYEVLHSVVRRMVDGEGLSADVEEVTWLCWSAMQGLVQLAPKFELVAMLRGDEPPEVDELIARFTILMVDGIRNAA